MAQSHNIRIFSFLLYYTIEIANCKGFAGKNCKDFLHSGGMEALCLSVRNSKGVSTDPFQFAKMEEDAIRKS